MLNLDENEPAGELDLAARQLCPDGACVGVIGDDERCKICGCQAEGALSCDALSCGVMAQAHNEVAESDEADDDFGLRELCPDGNCLGLIGGDGRCNICGRTV